MDMICLDGKEKLDCCTGTGPLVTEVPTYQGESTCYYCQGCKTDNCMFNTEAGQGELYEQCVDLTGNGGDGGDKPDPPVDPVDPIDPSGDDNECPEGETMTEFGTCRPESCTANQWVDDAGVCQDYSSQCSKIKHCDKCRGEFGECD